MTLDVVDAREKTLPVWLSWSHTDANVYQADTAARSRGKAKLTLRPKATYKVGALGPGDADLIKARTLQLELQPHGTGAAAH